MRKTRKTQGDPCVLGVSEKNATLKTHANFRVLITYNWRDFAANIVKHNSSLKSS